MSVNVTVETISTLGLASAITQINSNYAKLADEFDKVIYKDGREELTGNLDANSKRILNLPTPVDPAEPARLADLETVTDGVFLALLAAKASLADFAATSGATLVGYKASPPNALATTVDSKLREAVSIFDYFTAAQITSVRAFDYNEDVTTKIQLAFDDLRTGVIGGLYFPDGGYKLTSSITANQSIMTGWHVYGQSQNKTILKMYTANTPHFTFTFNQMHTILWETMQFQWNGVQTGNTSANVFKLISNGEVIRSLYNSAFKNLTCFGAYYFIDSTNTLFWGNEIMNCWVPNSVGGALKISGTAGQPNNIIFIKTTFGAPGVRMFDVGAAACTWHAEVLAHPGPVLYDGGGGAHNILYMSVEGGTYASGTVHLIDAPNSKVVVSGEILFKGMNLQAGAQVYGILTNGATGHFYGERATVTFNGGIAAQGAGAAFYLFGSGSSTLPAPMEFRTLNMEFSAPVASIVSSLTNYGSASTPDFVKISSWSDPNRVQRMDDANLTVAVSGPGTIAIAKPLTADRKIFLPYGGSGTGNNLFAGWERDIIVLPSQTGMFKVEVRNNSDTVLFGTIPAGASGRWKVRFDRQHLNLSNGSITSNFTFTYEGPIQKGVDDVQSRTGNYTLTLPDSGVRQLMNGSSLTLTIPANGTVAYPIGTVIPFTNLNATNLSIAITTDTLTLAGSTSTGTRTVAQNGRGVLEKVGTTSWLISGTGVT